MKKAASKPPLTYSTMATMRAAAGLGPDYEPSELVRVFWQAPAPDAPPGAPNREKVARWVRWNKSGSAVVQIEQVDARGRFTGRYGADRTFDRADIMGKVAPQDIKRRQVEQAKREEDEHRAARRTAAYAVDQLTEKWGAPGRPHSATVATTRRELGVTQAELAQMLGVHPMTVSKWERGELAPKPWERAMLDAAQRAASRWSELKPMLAAVLKSDGPALALYWMLEAAYGQGAAFTQD